MNDERMSINIYKLDNGYNDKEMNSEELIKDYKQNIQKWYLIAVADIVFALITAFVNFKVSWYGNDEPDYLYYGIGIADSKYYQAS